MQISTGLQDVSIKKTDKKKKKLKILKRKFERPDRGACHRRPLDAARPRRRGVVCDTIRVRFPTTKTRTWSFVTAATVKVAFVDTFANVEYNR
jgi:hypothetical protein